MPSSQNSIPLLHCPLNLSSLHAINVYRHTFLRMDHWLYKITITVRVHSERSRQYLDAISTVEETIHADFIAAQQALTDRHAALTRQLAERGLDATALTLSYRNPLNITVEIRTPNALRYIDLLQHLDRVCQTIDSAWFAGVLTVEEQLQSSRAAVQELTRLAGRVNTLVVGVARRILAEEIIESITKVAAQHGQHESSDEQEERLRIGEPTSIKAEYREDEPLVTLEGKRFY